MKKMSIINLIKYHVEKNDYQFRNEANEVAKYFDQVGDYQLSEYVLSLISDTNTFVPQHETYDDSFFKKIDFGSEPLPLPKAIMDDIRGIINAINHHAGINKFLFEGAPGTGKTETTKQIARLLDRQLFMVDFSALIDSKMGQTAKNIVSVFNEINQLRYPSKVVILFDEIDAIALDRVNSNDVREMGRVTSAILKELDKLNEEVVFIATTNLYDKFDKALIRRFDSTINFNRYDKDDLIEVAEIILSNLLKKFKSSGRDMKLFKKILNNMSDLPYPGDLKNLIKTALAFSDSNNEYDYLKRLLKDIMFSNKEVELKELQDKGFTLREIEVLTGVSKSQAARELKGL